MRKPPGGAMRCLAVLLAAVWVTAAVPSRADSDPVSDPLERMNRGIFWFNDGLDRYFLEPLAKGWDWVMPDAVQRSLRRFYDNSRFPITFANNVLQLKPNGAASELFRFLINTSVGLGGLFDPATGLGLNAYPEDFGQTLGYWGVPQGPYLVLPLLGPSNPRDGIGLAVDSAARVYPWFLPFLINAAITAPDVVNRRALNIEMIDAEREAAFDWYIAVRNAYVQLRRNQVHDREEEAEEESDDDLYYPEIDDDF